MSRIKTFRKICGLINDKGAWHLRYNHKLYQLYKEIDIIKVAKAGKVR
jgi:hypothetical protein